MANTIVLFLLLRSMDRRGVAQRRGGCVVCACIHCTSSRSPGFQNAKDVAQHVSLGCSHYGRYVVLYKEGRGAGGPARKTKPPVQSPKARHAILYYTLASVLFCARAL